MSVLNKAYENNLFNRSFGGTNEPGVADPYISGYGFVWFNTVPTMLSGNYTSLSQNDIQKTLSALSFSITIPNISLEKVTIQALGGTHFSAPSRLNIGDTFNITFLELSGTPIKSIINGWINALKDIRTGGSNLTGTQYRKSQYTSTVYYWTTKPDLQTIETAWHMTGVFPETYISNQFDTDVANNQEVRHDITFSFDNLYPYSAEQLAGSTNLLGKIQGFTSNILSYKQTLMNF
jgi:hypothetical protein